MRASQEACDDCPEPGLLPENIEACAVFLACQTQWRHAGLGQRTGLDYAGVQAVMALHGVEDQRGVFERIQIMERELIKIDQEARDRGA